MTHTTWMPGCRQGTGAMQSLWGLNEGEKKHQCPATSVLGITLPLLAGTLAGNHAGTPAAAAALAPHCIPHLPHYLFLAALRSPRCVAK